MLVGIATAVGSKYIGRNGPFYEWDILPVMGAMLLAIVILVLVYRRL